ncbi:hypothetical protein N7533_010450 [Penicillium manginii]|uniref:uncharacterized protein n=1 Tax=Penicillium manginii TaxID=203109 RepID=UPI00254976CD|nr:uncharacterized protein N7533_010450 [Penicillium manginii]KAJ5743348.1 hypothetical protein N7533_010450 [Penicillium manginii]
MTGSYGHTVFTRPDVTEQFMNIVPPSPQAMPFLASPTQAPLLPWGIQPSPAWVDNGQARPAKIMFFKWQSNQHRRKRQCPTARDHLSSSSCASPSAPLGTVLQISDRKILRQYYKRAFEDFQQLNCRSIAKSYIKLIEPRKQIHFPYNGRRVISGVSQKTDPELTKPGWWPEGVKHKEPDHLLKRDRLELLVHILCDLKECHGITAEKLCEAGQDVRHQITPPNKLDILDEIYFVRQMEERFIDGKIVKRARCRRELKPSQFWGPPFAPEMSLDVEGTSSSHHPIMEGAHQRASYPHGMPLWSASIDSSGPRSPFNSIYNTWSVNMGHLETFQDAQTEQKPLLSTPNYIPGYFPQQLVTVERPNTEYWPNIPLMPDPYQFEY